MRNLPLFPPSSEWVPPDGFPDLSSASEIAIDLETRDDNMDRLGPGWPRKDGYIVGYAVAVDGWKGYYPVAHAGGGNMDRRVVDGWMKDVLATPATKIMHNAAYDLGWLLASGFTVNGTIIDTMIAASLIDENRFSYALNSLGFDMLKEAKSEDNLKRAAADFGVHPKRELWKLPAMYVGEYAEQDAALTLKLWHHLQVLLRKEEVESIFALERDLLPVLVGITHRGIRFDRARAEELIVQMKKEEKTLLAQIKKEAGDTVDIWAAASIAKAFDKLGIAYPRTSTDQPSFTRTFLETCQAPIAQQLKIKAYIGQPLTKEDGSLFGTLCAIDPEPKSESLKEEQSLIELLGDLLSQLLQTELREIEQTRKNERLQAEALRDPLTGLYNRRAWDQFILAEEERCQLYGHPATVFMLDLNDLKFMNDAHGHAAGDELIRQTATVLTESCRNTDIIARIGGDEFAILTVENDFESSQAHLERIIQCLNTKQISAAIGFALRDPSEGILSACLQADKNMYQDKLKRH